MTDRSQSQKNLRGILAMTIAVGLFIINDTLVKLARAHWDTGQVLVVRGVFTLLLLAGWLGFARQFSQLPMIFRRDLLTRSVIEGVVAITFIMALGLMPLADITAILLATPLLITALSVIVLGEKVGWRRWSAVAVGFAGMLLVIRPGGSAIPPLALALALAAALGVAARDLMTRRVPADVPTVIVAVTSTLGTLVAGGVMAMQGAGWKPLEGQMLLILAAASVFVLAGNYAMIEACRDVELSVVSPFRYIVILWAVLLGILVFGEWPNPLAVLGIVLIVGSGLYTIHRERVRQRPQ